MADRDRKTEFLQVRVDRGLKEAVERAAVAEDVKMSHWVIRAIEEKLERKGQGMK